MFAKLLKHELKSGARLWIILSVCMLIMCALFGLDLKFVLREDTANLVQNPVLMIPAYLFMVFAYLGIIAYAVSNLLIPLGRFYKSRFTDEGYLTFTLPVKTSQIFLSSAVYMLIWQILSGLILILGISTIALIAIPWAELSAQLTEFFDEFTFVFGVIIEELPVTTYLITIPVTIVSSIVLPMTAVTIGAVAAKKHKILAAIGMYYAISIISNILTSMVTSIVSDGVMTYGMNITDTTEMLIPLVTSLIPFLLSVCGYLLSIHLMKNKLNLP